MEANWLYLLKVIISFLFVIGLIGVLSVFLRKISGHSFMLGRGVREKTVKIEEIVPLDGRRKLLLVRRGNVKHLLLTGGGNDLLVETVREEEENPG